MTFDDATLETAARTVQAVILIPILGCAIAAAQFVVRAWIRERTDRKCRELHGHTCRPCLWCSYHPNPRCPTCHGTGWHP